MQSVGGHEEAVKKLLDDPRLDPNQTSHVLSPLACVLAGSGSLELLEMLLFDQCVTVSSEVHMSIRRLMWAIL